MKFSNSPWFIAFGTFALALAACSSSGDNDSNGTGGGGGAGNAAGGNASGGKTTGTLSGNVKVELFPADQYATVSAQIFDGPIPNGEPLDVADELNGCQLLIPRSITCSPECGTTSVCTGNNQCTPKPMPKNVGVIHVQGLSSMAIDMDPLPPNFSYSGPTLQETYPPCTEGDDIKVQSDLFSITGKCITSLTLGGPTPIPVMSGSPVHLTWTAPGKANISRIQIELEISHHGGYKGEIDCDVPDTGSFDIPERLVTALIARGRAGYPTVKVTRLASASAPNESNVKLIMPSLVERAVDTGVISCGGQDSPPCPSGMTCSDFERICK
ncbi:MAG: hypothetical protein ACOY0T_31500 [Myxococcota bacterium]